MLVDGESERGILPGGSETKALIRGASARFLGSATDRGCRRRRHRDIGSGEELGFLSWDPELTCFFELGLLSSEH